MSEQQNNQSKQNSMSDDSYSFYWNYNEQLAHDQRKNEKKGKRGLIVYVSILAAVFLVCFALLAVTIILYGNGNAVPPITQESQEPQKQSPSATAKKLSNVA